SGPTWCSIVASAPAGRLVCSGSAPCSAGSATVSGDLGRRRNTHITDRVRSSRETSEVRVADTATSGHAGDPDDSRNEPGTRLPREIWVLVGGSFLIAIGYGLVAPALPTFAASFDVGITAASAVVSAFAGVRLVFAPLSGKLVTKLGERPVYLWGISIVAAGSIACAFAQDYWQLMVFRSASGIGSTMFTVSA